MPLLGAVGAALFAIFTAALGSTPPVQDHGDVYDGRAGQIAVRIPRIDTVAIVDGNLDEPVWRRAALLTGFSEYQPVDGRPALDSTEVLVWYSANAIYFGIRAFEAHGPVVRATLANRDYIDADDHVNILLDTYNTRRQALLFAVNALGIQEDGVWSDGVGASAGGQNSGGRTDASIDLNPDYVYQSQGHVTDWGYVVEVRIPFKSLHYQSRDPQTWGLQIDRVVQHSGYEETWTRVVRASTGYLLQAGTLTGLTRLERGLVMDLTPEATQKVDGAAPAVGPGYGYRGSVNLGGTVRWGVTSSLTAVGTVLPDFSQVEADVGQVSANQRFALYYPEKRPFFLEGLELFDTPNTLIYTRQIVQPDAGYKMIGEIGGMTLGYLGAVDTKDSATGAHPIYNVLRLRGNLGLPTTLGLVYTDRIESSASNRVLGGDARHAWNQLWYSQVQVVESWTRDSTGYRPGKLWDLTIADRTGRAYGNHFEVSGLSPEFSAQSGFVNRVGYERFMGDERFSWYGPPGAVIEQLTTRFVFNPLWQYGDLERGRGAFEGGLTDTWTAYLRGGWAVALAGANVMQGWDPASYVDYRVVHGTDTVAFRLPHALHGLWSETGSVTTPNRALYGTASLTLGAAPIFPEASRGREVVLQTEAVWHPTRSLRFDALWAHQTFDRSSDGSRAVTADIPRLKIEYQLTSAIFLRYVGQYTAQTETALRDPLTGTPLAVDSTTSVDLGLTPTRDFRQDVLFAFQPIPGTVLLLGYGATLVEPNALQFRDLSRQADGLILKLSYLFRL